MEKSGNHGSRGLLSGTSQSVTAIIGFSNIIASYKVEDSSLTNKTHRFIALKIFIDVSKTKTLGIPFDFSAISLHIHQLE